METLFWTGEVAETPLDEGGVVAELVLSDGSHVELWPDGISLSLGQALIPWSTVVAAIREAERLVARIPIA